MEYGAVIAAPYFVSAYTTYTPKYSVASFVSIPRASPLKSSNLLTHHMLSFWMKNSIAIRSWLRRAVAVKVEGE
jgi:hypothetical protein